VGPWNKLLVHALWIGLFVSGFPGAVLPCAAQQSVAAAEKQEGSSSTSSQPLLARSNEQPISELPDSPGAIVSKSEASQQQQSGNAAPAPNPEPVQNQPAQSQPPAQKPVGTAAAEAPNTSGIAASQPAGVAVAPAKQHRVRTIVLRTGAIIGAGVAVGTVVALTSATSSKPPGAH
jgi:hypothetical protein